MKILFHIYAIFLLFACNTGNDKPYNVVNKDGYNLITCNIDNIRDTCDLMLSDIAESADIVFLKDDNRLTEDDYKIQKVVVSEKYILVLPYMRPPLLYSRNGKLIRQFIKYNKKDNLLYGLMAQIDDKKNDFYIMFNGLELVKYNLYASPLNIIRNNSNSSFMVLSEKEKILLTFVNKDNIWGSLQSYHSPKPYYIYSTFSNNIFNYLSGPPIVIKNREKIIFSFRRVNDTSYLFNAESCTYKPFLYCFSKIHELSLKDLNKQNQNKIELKNDFLKRIQTISKKLQIVTSDFFIFRLGYSYPERYIIVDKINKNVFYLNRIINDFYGGLSMNYNKKYKGRSYFAQMQNTNYIYFIYNPDTLINIIKKTLNLKDVSNDNIKLTELHNRLTITTNAHNILFISKLKK